MSYLFLTLLSFAAAAAVTTGNAATTYPYPIKTFHFTSQKQKLQMAYMDIKPQKPNGKTVLLLHGKNFAGYYWQPTVQALREKGYRVIVPDQIGFGKSTMPPAYQYSFQQLAKNTRDLLDKEGVQNIVVAGHSMGGMLATRFALMYPGTTEKLILINPIGLEDLRDKVPYRSIDEVYAQELKQTADSIRNYQKEAYYAGEWKPEYEQLIQPQVESLKAKNYPAIAYNSALTYDLITTQPVVYEFPNIKTPTLLIIGQRDCTAPGKQGADPAIAKTLGDYPKLGKQAAAAIPKAKLVEIEGVGHVPQVENFPDYIKAFTEFIE